MSCLPPADRVSPRLDATAQEHLRFLLLLDAMAGRPVAPNNAELVAAQRCDKQWRVWVHREPRTAFDAVPSQDVHQIVEQIGDSPATWWAISASTGAVVPWERPTAEDEEAGRLLQQAPAKCSNPRLLDGSLPPWNGWRDPR